MINWEPELERHVRGRAETGDVWIRLDREGKVLGIYLMGRETQKWVPCTPNEETLAGAKRWANYLVAAKKISEE
jgi:hypothetical protein